MNEATHPVCAEAQPVKFTAKNLKNFWKKVNKEGSNPDINNPHYHGLGRCWEWIGGKNKAGYGTFNLHGRLNIAHRVSWMIRSGAIPRGMFVLHRCDNRACMNPDHFFIGTIGDNNRDRDKKGRGGKACGDANGSRLHPEKLARGDRHNSVTKPESVARGDRNGSRTKPESRARGLKHGRYTSPQSTARGEQIGNSKLTGSQIREIRRLRSDGALLREIAELYDLSVTHVSDIANNKIWKHIT